MEHNRYKYEYATERAKYVANEAIAYAKDLQNDPDKKQRLSECVCPVCYYRRVGRIGGARMTFSSCGGCSCRLSSGNTCVDVLCEKCAAERGCCKQCGGDLNLKMRRKLNF